MAEHGASARLAALRSGQARVLDRYVTRCPYCDQRILPPRWMTTPHAQTCPGLAALARA